MSRIFPCFFLLIFVYQAQALRLPDQTLSHYQCKNCVSLSHQTLLTSWLIEDKLLASADVKPVKSKRYYRKINGKDLKQGIELGLLGEKAVIRITPIRPRELGTKWEEMFKLQINGQKKPLADMVQSLSDEYDFKKQFSVGPALIFVLKTGLVKKNPRIVYDDVNLDDASQWLISVYDRTSNLYLSVSLDKNQYRIGDSVKALIEVNDAFNLPTVNWIEARIMSPTGDGIDVELNKDSTFHYHGEVPILSKQVARGENWRFWVMADLTVNDSHTIRTVSTAFSYVVPSAKIRAIYRPSKDQPLTLKASVEAIQASRYQLQGVIYATGDDGGVHSVALAQTSAWLAPGVSEMILKVHDTLPSNMHPPYYIGQLELIDDSQLKPVYHYLKQIALTSLDN